MPQALPTESPTRTEPPTLPGPQAEAPPAALEDPANSDAQQAAGAVRELKAELRAKAEAPVDENFELINKAFTAIAETQPLGDRVTQILVITNAEARVGLGNLAGLPPGNPDEQIIRTTVAALARLLPNLVQTLGTAGTLIEMIQQMADRMHGLDVVMRQRPHNVPLTQAEAQGILPDLLWAQMQTDELHSDLVQRIAATAAKTLYDGRPRIPSYFIYAVLNAAVNELRPLIEPIEQGLKEFTRHLETITKWLQDRAADIERRMNSPDTSQTDKGYLAGHLRMITELRETIIAQLKEVNELGATAPALIRAVIKPISTLLADPKRLEIFNQVSEARK
jgi:hypothetical protein